MGRAEVAFLERNQFLEQHGGRLGIAGGKLRLAEQVAHRAHGVVNVVGLLQRLDGLGVATEPQMRAADQEMRCAEIDINGQGFLCELDDLGRAVGQAMGIGQVEQQIGFGGLELE